MNKALWLSVKDLADLWREVSPLKTVVAAFSREGLGEWPIENMWEYHYVESVLSRPLRAYSEILFWEGQAIPYLQNRPALGPNVNHAAQEVEQVYRLQVAWVRAQLPRYPMLRTPHLVPNTSFTMVEYSRRVTWSRSDMGRELQFAPPPYSASMGESVTMRQVLASIVNALRASAPWQRFAGAQAALEDLDLLDLRTASNILRSELSPDRVDGYELELQARRNEYREDRLRAAISQLSGRAWEYADSFSEVADLVDFALDDILSRLVVDPTPLQVHGLQDLDFLAIDRISFISNARPLKPGVLVFIVDPLVEEVGQVISSTMVMESGEFQQRLEVRLALGAAEGWRS